MRTSLPLVLLLSLLAGCTGNVGADPEPDSKASALARARDPVDTVGVGGVIVQPTRYRAAVQPRAVAALLPPHMQSSYATLLSPPPTFTNREVVGMVPGTEQCPVDNADWRGGSIFGSTFVPSPNGNRFCSYKWQGAGAPNINTLPKYCPSGKNCEPCPAGWICAAPPTGDKWLEPSHMGMLAAGLPADVRQVISSKIKAQHLAAIGAPAAMPSGSAPSSGWFPYSLPTWFTKVYVLDDGGLHGDTVESWIKQTACPSGNGCPWIVRSNVFENGETAGSVLTLAQKIVAAVNESQGQDPIINLSVGFHWQHAWLFQPGGGDVAPPIRFAHEALQSAINYAGCNGAIVVAAAGNKDGGAQAEDTGPRYFGGSAAYPAAFSKVGQGWTCTASPTSANRLLVVPVGSIRADGAISPSARQFGRSCLTAPSTALTPEGDPVEGSSFATATLTGVLANARSYMPGASAIDVIQTVISQMPQTSTLDYKVCHGHTDGIRRVHQCKAIKKALERTCQNAGNGTIASQYGFACGLAAQLTCPEIGAQPYRLSVADAAADTLEASVSDPARQQTRAFVPVDAALPSGTDCSVAQILSDPNQRNDRTCPTRTFDNGQTRADRIFTSPGEPGCGCTLVMRADRSLWLMGTILTSGITSPALRVKVSGTANFLYFANGEGDLYELGLAAQETAAGGFSIRLTDPLPEGSRVEEAEFSFLLGNAANPQALSSTLPIIEAAP